MRGNESNNIVLIVAKCIVNMTRSATNFLCGKVLIVAKCIVNQILQIKDTLIGLVLIVAKCIVNKQVKKMLQKSGKY